jgi:hypothetical protein
LPRLPAVARPEDSALVVGPKRVAEGCHEHDIRVARMDDYRADVPRIGEADMLPGLAGIE